MGVYGGFVQAGVGFFILALAMLAGFDLVRGNALKVLVVLVFTPLAFILFAMTLLILVQVLTSQGSSGTDWPFGSRRSMTWNMSGPRESSRCGSFQE